MYTGRRLSTPLGFDLHFLTHWSILVTMICVLGLVISTGVSKFLYNSVCFKGSYIQWVEVLTGIFTLSLVSLQFLLSIGSLGLATAYDGSALDIGDGATWISAALDFQIQHSLSFFFAIALIGGRYECQELHFKKFYQRLVWFCVPVAVTLAWITMLLFSTTEVPYSRNGSLVILFVVWAAAVAPWSLIGYYVC